MIPRCFVWNFLICSSAVASDLPDTILPQGVGVNIHFHRGHQKDLDMIAAAGFRFIRMDLGWGAIERNKGEYDWTAPDELIANLERRGLRAIFILDYSNPLYEEEVSSKNPISGKQQGGTASPQHPESVAGFAKWAAAAAKHWKGHRVIWEIWNEPNISFWKPKPDVDQYITLAIAACKAIREADADATIIAPATSRVPLDFLEKFCASGVLQYLDAVSVHPYRSYNKGPETAAEDYKKLREIIERHAPAARKQMPIISGEWGYASHSKGVSPERQAAFIVRQQLSNLLNGIPLSIWYDWKNDGEDPDEGEHNFGAVTHDLKPKPAYLAIQKMTRELSGYRIERRVQLGSEADFALILRNASKDAKLVAWTTGEAHKATIETSPGKALTVQLAEAPEYSALRE